MWVTLLALSFVAGVTAAGWVLLPSLVCSVLGLLGALWMWVPRVGVVGVVVAGLSLGQLAVALLPDGLRLDGEVAFVGEVVRSHGFGAVVDLRSLGALGAPDRPASGRVWVHFGDRSPHTGTMVVGMGRARPYWRGALPGAPDPVRAARRSRIHTEIRARVWRAVGPSPVQRSPIHDPTGVLRAIALGDRSGLDAGVVDSLRRSGTAHVLAISGFHVGLVGGAVAGGLGRCVRALGALFPGGLALGWTWLAGAVAGSAYAMAVGAPVSAQRAAGLLLLLAVGKSLGRVNEPLRLLGVVAVGVLMIDPAAIASPGFQMSFGAFLGLVRVSPVVHERLRWLPRWLAMSLSATAGASLGVLPAQAWWFQQLAPVSPLANLLALPWTAVAIAPCAAAACWGPDNLAGAASRVGTWAVQALVEGLGYIDIEPWAPAVGPVGALLLLGPVIWPRRPTLAGALMLMALGVRQVPVVDTVTFLDVGQGDAALVELADGRRWLIDTGLPGDRVLHWLRRRGVRRLDVVVASHGQRDHVGAMPAVLRGITVDALWYIGDHGMDQVLGAARQAGIRVVRRPASALHPMQDFESPEVNDHSVVLLLAGVLFTGDIEHRAEQAMSPPAVDVLKVGHHGSRTSSSAPFLHAARPKIAVISAGRGNVYGHPAPEVLDRLRDMGAAVFRTDEHGTIQITRDGELRVRTHLPGRGWADAGSWP